MNIAVIGAGKVGSVLGWLLVEHGETVTCVVSRTIESARRAGKFLHCSRVSTSLDALPAETDLILITAPHAAVETVAKQLALLQHLNFKRLAVCHASGMLTAEALNAVRRRGATVFSFHPLQTFPRDFRPSDIVGSARGIYYGVDGSPKALRFARQLATALGGTTIIIPPDLRAFYHAACVVASNHLTVMMAILEKMFLTLRTKSKDFYPVFEPIITATLENIKATSPAHALSGPVARGGADTVAEHFVSLKKHSPELLPYFLRLTLETVKLASAKGSINRIQTGALREVVRTFSSSSPSIQELH
jgi:predicted short-subunit dehydrogenase-like oxidoreductase (DUF2520 family)